MMRHWMVSRGGWMAMVAAGAMLLASGHLSAQPTRPQGAPGFVVPETGDDEVVPRLMAGPGGDVYRLWERRADQRTGGGAVMLAVASPPGGWRTLVEMRSPEKGVTFRGSDLAISSASEMALVYRWWRDHPRAKQLRLARSDDGGRTWVKPATPIDTSGKTFDPNVAWGKDRTLLAVWADERRGNKSFDVYARRSPDAGATWEPEKRLSQFAEELPTDVFAGPRLVGDGLDRYWVVWVGVRGGRSSLYMRRSVDGGRNWTDPVALTGASQSVYSHSLHRAGDRMLLVWIDRRTGRDRVYAVSSTDGGVTWTEPVGVDHLAADRPLDASAPAALLSADGEALAAWQDGRNGRDDIFLSRSTDGGRTWGSGDMRMDMDETGTAVSRYPRLARARDGRVALAWDDDRAGFEAVYVRVRSAGDKPVWGPEIRVSSPAPKRAARLPQLLWAPDGLLHVAWEVWDHTLAPGSLSKSIDGTSLRPATP